MLSLSPRHVPPAGAMSRYRCVMPVASHVTRGVMYTFQFCSIVRMLCQTAPIDVSPLDVPLDVSVPTLHSVPVSSVPSALAAETFVNSCAAACSSVSSLMQMCSAVIS